MTSFDSRSISFRMWWWREMRVQGQRRRCWVRPLRRRCVRARGRRLRSVLVFGSRGALRRGEALLVHSQNGGRRWQPRNHSHWQVRKRLIYRVVQQDLALEFEVFHMLFYRHHCGRRKRSLKLHNTSIFSVKSSWTTLYSFETAYKLDIKLEGVIQPIHSFHFYPSQKGPAETTTRRSPTALPLRCHSPTAV